MKKKIVWFLIAIIILVLDCFYSVVDRDVKIYNKDIDSSAYSNIGEIIDGNSISQDFLCKRNGLYQIKVRFSTLNISTDTKLNYTIENANTNQLVSSGSISTQNIENNAFHIIQFSKQNDSKGQIYNISFEASGVSAGQGVTIYTTEPDIFNKGLTINGEKSNQSMVLSYITKGFDIETLVLLVLNEILISIFIIVLIKILR